jgi:hypothetical protein
VTTVSRAILETIVLQHISRSDVAWDTQSITIARQPDNEPNWTVISADPAVQMIVADLQEIYSLEE